MTEEGDIVMVHSRVILTPKELEIAVMHIQQYEKRLVVEMWSMGQAIPAYVMNKDGAF